MGKCYICGKPTPGWFFPMCEECKRAQHFSSGIQHHTHEIIHEPSGENYGQKISETKIIKFPKKDINKNIKELYDTLKEIYLKKGYKLKKDYGPELFVFQEGSIWTSDHVVLRTFKITKIKNSIQIIKTCQNSGDYYWTSPYTGLDADLMDASDVTNIDFVSIPLRDDEVKELYAKVELKIKPGQQNKFYDIIKKEFYDLKIIEEQKPNKIILESENDQGKKIEIKFEKKDSKIYLVLRDNAGFGMCYKKDITKNFQEYVENLVNELYKKIGIKVKEKRSQEKNVKFCTECGKKIKKTAKFCEHCGTKNG